MTGSGFYILILIHTSHFSPVFVEKITHFKGRDPDGCSLDGF